MSMRLMEASNRPNNVVRQTRSSMLSELQCWNGSDFQFNPTTVHARFEQSKTPNDDVDAFRNSVQNEELILLVFE